MLKIAICDDHPTTCTELENILLEFQEQTFQAFTIEVFYSGEELIEYIKKEHKFDLIFLDIELGEINGVEVGHIIRNEMEDYSTKIVYISSKDHYDRQLFEVQPLHFLPKPLDKGKIFKDIGLAIKMIQKEKNLFSFKINQAIHKIPIKDILYFESFDKKIKLVGTKATKDFYDKMEHIIEQVSRYRFMHPHRSYLINYDHVLRFKKDKIFMSNGDCIPISRLKKKDLKKLQMIYEENE